MRHPEVVDRERQHADDGEREYNEVTEARELTEAAASDAQHREQQQQYDPRQRRRAGFLIHEHQRCRDQRGGRATEQPQREHHADDDEEDVPQRPRRQPRSRRAIDAVRPQQAPAGRQMQFVRTADATSVSQPTAVSSPDREASR